MVYKKKSKKTKKQKKTKKPRKTRKKIGGTSMCKYSIFSGNYLVSEDEYPANNSQDYNYKYLGGDGIYRHSSSYSYVLGGLNNALKDLLEKADDKHNTHITHRQEPIKEIYENIKVTGYPDDHWKLIPHVSSKYNITEADRKRIQEENNKIDAKKKFELDRRKNEIIYYNINFRNKFIVRFKYDGMIVLDKPIPITEKNKKKDKYDYRESDNLQEEIYEMEKTKKFDRVNEYRIININDAEDFLTIISGNFLADIFTRARGFYYNVETKYILAMLNNTNIVTETKLEELKKQKKSNRKISNREILKIILNKNDISSYDNASVQLEFDKFKALIYANKINYFTSDTWRNSDTTLNGYLDKDGYIKGSR